MDMEEETVNCTFVGEEGIMCNGTLYVLPEEKLNYHNEWFWIYLGIYVALVLLAGLVSGLTMGLLSLDMMTLKILKEGGSPKEKKYAARILPVVQRHHLLLVTLLLANAAAVEAMPIFLDRISDPITAICVSVSAVLLFGEVFPQALCTRFGLAIGATLAPFVYLLMGLLFVVAWPLSKLLDCLLGKEHDTFYRRAQLKVLVDLHGPVESAIVSDDATQSDPDHLTVDEVLIIKGALDMKDKVVEDAMLPIKDVYMLELDSKLDQETMDSVLAAAHSRIPVYCESRHNVIGLILVKMLIKLSPKDATPISQLIRDPNCFRKVPSVPHDMALFDLLNLFQTGKSHLCLVTRSTSPEEVDGLNVNSDSQDIDTDTQEVVGIITLEDVIEELIQEEIIDETDVFVDVQKRIRVARARAARRVSCPPELGESSRYPRQDSYQINKGETGARARRKSDEPLLDITTDASAPLLSNEVVA
ncbi:uncharacterized protein LOC135479502 [Liolophura sinensis]|uniref:uncharacterized protein LOC135479502 n=1 Tax=Liolophura sinensis TaxID=3198878 RepID=UPI003158614D